MKDLIIIGAGGHARPVVAVAQTAQYNLIGCIDVNYTGQSENILGTPVIGDLDKLNTSIAADTALFVAVGDNAKRKELLKSFNDTAFEIISLIHSTAIIAADAQIGKGTFISAGTILNPGVQIGEGCIINTGSIIDHESIVGDFTHIAPGTSIAGRVKIGTQTFIGIGSSIIDQITIGAGVTVGAGSVILDHIEPNSTVHGVHKKSK